MASFVWGRDPQEAFDNPYEYDAQEQFVREASAFLKIIFEKLHEHNRKFHRDDTSLIKAIWMLDLDMIDSLQECLDLLVAKRHRIASRLFRDVVESLDLLKLFNSGTDRSEKLLLEWYKNEVISHGEARNYLKEVDGENASKNRRDYYRQLSKFTHRTYRALTDSYILAKDDLLVHDSIHLSKSLILPHYFSISSSFSRLNSASIPSH